MYMKVFYKSKALFNLLCMWVCMYIYVCVHMYICTTDMLMHIVIYVYEVYMENREREWEWKRA